MTFHLYKFMMQVSPDPFIFQEMPHKRVSYARLCAHLLFLHSVHARFASIMFTVWKWGWWCRHFLNVCISVVFHQRINLTTR